MFNFIKNIFERIKKAMFPVNDIKKALNIDIAISSEMANAIEEWKDIFENKAYWLDEEKGVFSLEIASAVCKEIADTVTSEVTSKITDNDYLDEQYQYLIDDMNDWLQLGLAKGGIAIKPYISNDEIVIDYVQADSFYPVEYNNRKLITAAVFIEQIVKGDYVYSRLEYQKYFADKKKHIFINQAFRKRNDNVNDFSRFKDLGNEISLDEVEEWQGMESYFEANNIRRPLFAYFKVPGINNIDSSSPLGIPSYKKAIPLIKEADTQYSRYIWEFEGGELAVDAAEDLFKVDNKTKEPKLPQGKKRLFRQYDAEVKEDNNFFKVFAPVLRDSNYAEGFNNILKRIEFNCGLAYGDLSDPQSVDKTATEIKSSKQRKYTTVTGIQDNLDKLLKHVVYIMNVYAIGLHKSNSNDVSLETDWGDSILVDSEKQRNIDLQEVNAGLMPEWKYKVKWQGMTEDEAKAEVEETKKIGIEFE